MPLITLVESRHHEPGDVWTPAEKPTVADEGTTAAAAADARAAQYLADEPESRAEVWDADVWIGVLEVPDAQEPGVHEFHHVEPVTERLLLGGAHLRATAWWKEFDAAREAFMTDARPRLGGRQEAHAAWLTSTIRRTLLDRRPTEIDGHRPPSHHNPGDTAMRSTITDPLHEQAARLRRLSAATEQLDPKDHYVTVLAEFLMAAVAERRWFRADHDPEPGPDVTRLFDGARYYQRVDAVTWRQQDDGTNEGAGPLLSWKFFAGKIVVDASKPRTSSLKINNPSPNAPIADWQTHTPGEVEVMLQQAMQEMRHRVANGAVDGMTGTRWTSSQHGPILLISLGDHKFPAPAPAHTESNHGWQSR